MRFYLFVLVFTLGHELVFAFNHTLDCSKWPLGKKLISIHLIDENHIHKLSFYDDSTIDATTLENMVNRRYSPPVRFRRRHFAFCLFFGFPLMFIRPVVFVRKRKCVWMCKIAVDGSLKNKY